MYREFVRELKAVRGHYTFSFKVIAGLAGISPSYIKRLEDGEIKTPPHEKLGKIANSIFILVNEKGKWPEDFNYPTIIEIYDWNLKHGGLKVEEEKKHANFFDESDEIEFEEFHVETLVRTLEIISEFYMENLNFKEPVRQMILKNVIPKDSEATNIGVETEMEIYLLYTVVATYSQLNPWNREILEDFCRLLIKNQRKRSK